MMCFHGAVLSWRLVTQKKTEATLSKPVIVHAVSHKSGECSAATQGFQQGISRLT